MLRADVAIGLSDCTLVRRSVVNVLVVITAALSFVYLTYAILCPDRF
jgi:K+-transporting ATPase KdpF subunit